MALKPPDIDKGLYHSFLADVLRIFMVSRNPQGAPEHLPKIGFDKSAEGLPIAGLSPAQEDRLVELDTNLPWGFCRGRPQFNKFQRLFSSHELRPLMGLRPQM